MNRFRSGEGPPAAYWLIPLAVGTLRAVPFLATRVATPPPDSYYPPIGYNPIDWSAYVGFIRQAAETGQWLLFTPHTTLPQDGRYFLPLFSLLGWVCRLTGLDPFWALELARLPLIFAFFAVFWRLAGDFLPERRERLLAAGLLAFSGGAEILVYATLSWWPERWHRALFEALSDDYGWNTFAALYNPLWVAGLTLAQLALRPILKPTAAPVPKGTKTAGRTFASGPGRCEAVRVAVWTMLTFGVHPYSGLGVLAISGGVLAARLANEAERAGALRMGAGLCLAAGALAGFSLWQNQDAVFHATARRFFGPHGLSMLWYPLTLGATGVLAVWGARLRHQAGWHGTRELLVWAGVVALLHSSPWTRGYHFVFLLHLPLAVLAAPALDRLLEVFGNESAPISRQLGAALVVALTFQSAPAVTWRSTRLTLNRPFPVPVREALEVLAREPPAAVYTSPYLGTLIPGNTPHRVVAGHWFLTPDHAEQRARYSALMAGEMAPEEWLEDLRRQGVRYVLLPPRAAPAVVSATRTLAARTETFGAYHLFWIAP